MRDLLGGSRTCAVSVNHIFHQCVKPKDNEAIFRRGKKKSTKWCDKAKEQDENLKKKRWGRGLQGQERSAVVA